MGKCTGGRSPEEGNNSEVDAFAPRDESSQGKLGIARPCERRKWSDKRTKLQNQDGSSEWRSLTGGGDWGTVWRQTEPGRPKSGLREEAVQQQYLPSPLSIPIFWDSWAAASLVSDGKFWELQQIFLSTRLHLHQFPLSGEVNTSEASLYTRARHHHRSLPFKLLKRQWFGVSPPAKESVIERKRDPAFSLRQSLLSPAMAQLLDVHPVLCLLDPFRRHVNSIIHQETKPAGEEGKGEISAGLIELNQLRKG